MYFTHTLLHIYLLHTHLCITYAPAQLFASSWEWFAKFKGFQFNATKKLENSKSKNHASHNAYAKNAPIYKTLNNM